MAVPVILHELARDAADPLRAEFPDRLLDLEHRGAAEGPWDPARVTEALAILLRHAFAHGSPDEALWMRTTGDADGARADLEWTGELLPESLALRAAKLAGGRVECTGTGPRIRATLTLRR